MAEKGGLFEGMVDSIDVLKEGMGALVAVMAAMAESMGVTLPENVEKYIASLAKIPTNVDTKVNVTYPNGPPPDGSGDGGGNGPPDEPTATGGVFTSPSRRLVGEAGAEVVAPVSALFGRLANDIVGRMAAAGGTGGEVHIYLDPTTGNARQLSTAEVRRLQASLIAGQIRVPKATVG